MHHVDWIQQGRFIPSATSDFLIGLFVAFIPPPPPSSSTSSFFSLSFFFVLSVCFSFARENSFVSFPEQIDSMIYTACASQLVKIHRSFTRLCGVMGNSDWFSRDSYNYREMDR